MTTRILVAVCSLALALATGGCSGAGGDDGGTGGGGGSTGGGGGSTGGGGGSTGGGGGSTGGGGGSTGGGGGSTGGGGGSTGGGGGSTGGGGGTSCVIVNPTCHSLAVAGIPVAVQNSTATPPTPAGGTAISGIYTATAVTQYDPDAGAGPTGEVRQETVEMGPTTVNMANRRALPDGGCEDERRGGTLAFSGTNLTFTQTCPTCTGTDCGGTIGYTATPTTFTIFEQGDSTAVVTFTKQ